MKLLKNFTGYLQPDGYSVYEWFAKQPGITHVVCMAHARRKFEQALDYDAPKAGWIVKKNTGALCRRMPSPRGQLVACWVQRA